MVKPNDITPLPINGLQGNVSTKLDYKSLFFNIDDRILRCHFIPSHQPAEGIWLLLASSKDQSRAVAEEETTTALLIFSFPVHSLMYSTSSLK